MSNHPKLFNSNHFSTEKFPEVIGFCDRDASSHIVNNTEESYQYSLNETAIYVLKKYATKWELLEMKEKKVIRVSTGSNLGIVLMQGLNFASRDKDNQEDRVSIIFPIAKADTEKTLAFMYYYGGYPGNFLPPSAELAVITERFVGPEIVFFSFSYVPVGYLDWLRETLTKAELLQDGTHNSLWVYKK